MSLLSSGWILTWDCLGAANEAATTGSRRVHAGRATAFGGAGGAFTALVGAFGGGGAQSIAYGASEGRRGELYSIAALDGGGAGRRPGKGAGGVRAHSRTREKEMMGHTIPTGLPLFYAPRICLPNHHSICICTSYSRSELQNAVGGRRKRSPL